MTHLLTRRWELATLLVSGGLLVFAGTELFVPGASGATRRPAAIEPEVEVLGVPVPVEDPTGHALDAFHEALARVTAQGGQARLLFLGASHTASDQYTSALRARLQARFGDAGPGFVQPVKPFAWYAHRDLRLAHGGRWTTIRADRADEGPTGRLPHHVGLAGFAVETDRAGAWASVWPRREEGRGTRFSRVEVHYLAQPGGGRFDVFVDGKGVRRVTTGAARKVPRRVVLRVPDASHRVRLRVHGDGPVRLLGAVLERQGPGVVVDALGVPGSRAADQLPGDPALFRAHLRMRRPDLVALAWGTNEVLDRPVPIERYEADLRRLVSRVRTAVPKASCLVVGPSDRPKVHADGRVEPRQRAAAVVAVQRRVAREAGCGFFDLVALQGGPGAMARWVAHEPPLARDDHTHFTDRGYERLAELLERALLSRGAGR